MSPSEKIKSKELQLSEWRRKYDALDDSYDKIRGRSVTLLTIQLGIIGYFLTQLPTLIKPQLYGQIFFVFAAILALYAIGCSIRNYRTKHSWASPIYELEIEKMDNASNYVNALQVALDDYKFSYDHNLTIHEPAANRLNHSLFVFIAAAIMLLVLNFAK